MWRITFLTLLLVTMALDYAQGAIQWLLADGLGVTYTVSGLSFQPKALRFEMMGITSTTDASTETRHLIRSIGFATSTSSRRCAATFSEDAAGSATTGNIATNDTVAVYVGSVGSVIGSLDLDLIGSDGFRLIIDNPLAGTADDITVLWKAWGGSDITNVTVGDFAEPAATGTQNYTATGFVTAGTDQAVMLAGVQATTINTGLSDSSTLSIGYATGSASANNINLIGQSDDGAATMDTDGACYTGECLAMIVPAGAAVKNARATLSAFGTDLFTLDWLARTTTGRLSIYMAIKGGNWTAGSYTIDGTTFGNLATVSGLSYAPGGLLLMGRMTAVQAVDVTTVNDRIGWGSGTSSSNMHAMGGLDEDATANSEIDQSIRYSSILSFPTTAGQLLSVYVIDAMNADGFRMKVGSPAGGVVSEWQGYLAFGSVAGAALAPPPQLPSAQRYMRSLAA